MNIDPQFSEQSYLMFKNALSFHKIWFKSINNLRYPGNRQTKRRLQIGIRNIRLAFGTDEGSVFQFFIVERQDILGIEYELKELRMNVYVSGGIGRRITNGVGGGLRLTLCELSV